MGDTRTGLVFNGNIIVITATALPLSPRHRFIKVREGFKVLKRSRTVRMIAQRRAEKYSKLIYKFEGAAVTTTLQQKMFARIFRSNLIGIVKQKSKIKIAQVLRLMDPFISLCSLTRKMVAYSTTHHRELEYHFVF